MPESKKQATSGGLRVIAQLVQVKSDNGKVVYLSFGDMVPDHITKASVEHLESLGFIEKA